MEERIKQPASRKPDPKRHRDNLRLMQLLMDRLKTGEFTVDTRIGDVINKLNEES